MATAQDVLNAARAEIGYSRWNDPEAGTKYGRWYAKLVNSSYYGTSGVPFCAMFVSWCMNKVGATCAGIPGAYTPTMLQAAKNAGKVRGNKRDAKPGDVAYFNWDGGVVDHVGFIEVNYGDYVQTIEGNTDNGQVKRKTRNWSTIEAVVAPNYGTSSSTSGGTSVSTPSANVSNASSAKISEDGWWGPKTTTRLQQYLGTPVDGIVSNQYATYKAKNPGLQSNTWQWKSNPGKNGSDMVRALQRKLGVTADGFIGPNTIKALQKKLGTSQDGCCSGPSDVVKALQKALNNNKF